MSIYTAHACYGVVDNPLTDSPYVAQFDIGYNIAPPGTDFMITETGIFMITESASDFMITE